METLDRHTEFETKYRVDGDLQFKFKALVSELDYKQFIYAEGPDYYFTKPDGSFLRYRKAATEKRSEVTLKEKPKDAKHNVLRKEVNWRVDYTSKESIHEGAEMMGFTFNFSIWKACHIYKMKDGTTLVFYTVRGEDNKVNHFIEIELDEDKIGTMTYEEAMDKIRSYEKILSPLGISHNKRLTKSLYEMYVKEIDYDKKSDKTKAAGNS
jgi:adenylate cyclase class IV